MRQLLFLGAALLAATQPAAGLALAPPVAATVSQTDALELARLMAPRGPMVEAELREYDKHFITTLRSNAEMKALDDQYPGLFDAMHQASRPLVEVAMDRAITRVHADASRILAARLNAEEMASLAVFYRSPLGQKVVLQMISSADAADIYQQALEQPDRDVTTADMERQIAASARRTATQLTTAEQVQMVEFMGSPGYAKLAAIRPEILKVMAEATNARDPEMEKKVDEVMATVVEQHIARLSKGK